jgi:hypothetical protein
MRSIARYEPLVALCLGVARMCRMRSSALAVVDVPAMLCVGATERSWDFAGRLSQRFLWMVDIALREYVLDISSNCCSKHYLSRLAMVVRSLTMDQGPRFGLAFFVSAHRDSCGRKALCSHRHEGSGHISKI